MGSQLSRPASSYLIMDLVVFVVLGAVLSTLLSAAFIAAFVVWGSGGADAALALLLRK